MQKLKILLMEKVNDNYPSRTIRTDFDPYRSTWVIFIFILIYHLDEENLFAWRLYDRIQNKTYLFSHRTPLDKIQIMDALEYERAYVEENLSKGLEIPLYTRLTTLKSQQYFADQSFPSITKQS